MQDTAPPSPATRAALDECAAAVIAERAAHARTLASIGTLSRTDAVSETGHRALGRLLEEHLRIDAAEARRLIRHAGLLTVPGPEAGPFAPTEPDLPATAEATGDGALDADHITIIDKTVTRLRRVVPALPPAMIDEAERQLAGLARHRTPQQTADAAHEILLRHDPDGEGPHDADRPAEELRLHTGRDGTLTGRFRFAEPDAAEAIRSAIEARTPPPEPGADTTILRPGRELHERRGEALRALVDDAGPAGSGDTPEDDAGESAASVGPHLADDEDPSEDPADELDPIGQPDATASAADRLAAPHEPAPESSEQSEQSESPDPSPSPDRRPARDRPTRETTMIVTVGLDVLTGAGRGGDGPRQWQGPTHPGFGLLDGRWTLSPEAARRMACEAAIIPAVLGSHGEVLDLGRKTRVVSTAQRRAVIARDRHCAHPGCRRSPRYCDVHHVVPWFLGGRTDLLNLVLLCPYHHHQVHHSGWQVHLRDGVPWFVPPAWLDPLRTPRTNRIGQRAA